MSKELSENELIRNEQIARKKNTHIKNGIKNYFQDEPKIKSAPLEFTCECSDPNCKKHIKISINAYENVHKRNDRFAIKKGHETAKVEKVVAEKPDYNIVEKEELRA
jgi:hypothetical protein